MLHVCGPRLRSCPVLLPVLLFHVRVSAHFVEQPSREASKPTTTILIKFDPIVMQRQAVMDAKRS